MKRILPLISIVFFIVGCTSQSTVPSSQSAPQGVKWDIWIAVADPDGSIRVNGDSVHFDALREKLVSLVSSQDRTRSNVQVLRPGPSPNRNFPETDRKADAVIQLLRDLRFERVAVLMR